MMDIGSLYARLARQKFGPALGVSRFRIRN
jgi:hypothetical protein